LTESELSHWEGEFSAARREAGLPGPPRAQGRATHNPGAQVVVALFPGGANRDERRQPPFYIGPEGSRFAQLVDPHHQQRRPVPVALALA